VVSKKRSGLSYHQFEEPTWKILQTFENPSIKESHRDLQKITFETKEVTALCPLTGFPDYYHVKITYIPVKKCIESKSAKFYFGAYRDYRGFIETITKKILDDWKKACKPRWIEVNITMNPRGGISINVIKTYQK
jgi:7-cyano-7-deazaguanine reductase